MTYYAERREKFKAGVNKRDCFVAQWVGNGSKPLLQVVQN
jgi:hypothetical protein